MHNFLIVTFPANIRRQLELFALDEVTAFTGLKWIGACQKLEESTNVFYNFYFFDLQDFGGFGEKEIKRIADRLPKSSYIFKESIQEYDLSSYAYCNWKVL